MKTHAVEIFLLLAVAMHAAMHIQEDLVHARSWLSKKLGIEQFAHAGRIKKILMVLLMVLVAWVVVSPFVYYGFECTQRLSGMRETSQRTETSLSAVSA